MRITPPKGHPLFDPQMPIVDRGAVGEDASRATLLSKAVFASGVVLRLDDRTIFLGWYFSCLSH